MFKSAKIRENFIELIEDDYKGYGIDHRQADAVMRRSLKVKLPQKVYGNLKELFLEFLSCLYKEMKEQDKEDQVENIEILLRLMVYSRLFMYESQGKTIGDSIMQALSDSSSSTACTVPGQQKRMI